MPYPFSLPTASSLPISTFLRCETHPTLILSTTTQRNTLRTLLRSHSKTPPSQSSSLLPQISSALSAYLPSLYALSAGLSSRPHADEEILIALSAELESAWTPVLLPSALPGRPPPRVRGKGLDYELGFVLATCAYVQHLLARRALHSLYAPSSSSSTTTASSQDQRARAIETATRHLLAAHGIHSHISRHSSDSDFPPQARDLDPAVQSALALLALAEATLLAITTNDPYPALLRQAGNRDDREWMYKAPSIPKVRAGLFVRLAVQGAEHAGGAHALLQGSGQGGGKGLGRGKGGGVEEGLLRFAKNLAKTARARACRFAGIEAETGGKVGEGIAWVEAGRGVLGLGKRDERGKGVGGVKGGWKGLKGKFEERREEKRLERGEEWGADAGRGEEGRVLDGLWEKWNRENDLVHTQLVPLSEPLLSSLPSGREFHRPTPFVPPTLDPDVLAHMRAPVDRSELAKEEAQSDEDSDAERAGGSVDPPGAFPGQGASESTYY